MENKKQKKKTDNSDLTAFRIPIYMENYFQHYKNYNGIDRSNLLRIMIADYIKKNPL